MDRSMIDQFASYEGEGGLKGAMDVLNVERIFVPVEDNGVAIYSGQGEPFRLPGTAALQRARRRRAAGTGLCPDGAGKKLP